MTDDLKFEHWVYFIISLEELCLKFEITYIQRLTAISLTLHSGDLSITHSIGSKYPPYSQAGKTLKEESSAHCRQVDLIQCMGSRWIQHKCNQDRHVSLIKTDISE